ncbi:MAG: glycosyltransferase, partial [Actinomycetota bacterium]
FVEEEDRASHVAGAGGDDPNLWTLGVEFEDGGDPQSERTDRQYRVGARLLREIAGRWSFPIDERHVLRHRELDARKACPGGLDVPRLIREANEPPPFLVCLLPVRNGERDLPGYLESVERFADAIVALDDGSTDRTGEILEGHPLVEILLTNPPRSSSAGWDDAANRNELLEAAEQVDPDWVISLDVDERIEADDAEALRRFIARDALSMCAYGFRHFRAWHGRYEARSRWIYRLFAFEPGSAFAEDRLHFEPIPVRIPPRAWLRTTIRVRHLAAEDEGRIAERLEKYRQADPEGEYPVDFGGLDRPPDGPLVEWEPRPRDLAVLVEAAEPPPAPTEDPEAEAPDTAHDLVCLLPVRDGEEDLPGYLRSVQRFADAVVALDDGSTDRTGKLLEAHPLVKVVLSNPRRASYEGWDDAANRRRLLEAAAGLRPRWIMSLDADERIDPADAAALRAFIATARGDLAYEFRVHRMIGGLDRYDRSSLWVCRLFAYRPGQRFPGRRLHFVPIPESIPRTRWVRTTLRIQHLAGATEERRAERYRKYVEADPDRAFQADYEDLLAEPRELIRWSPRPPDRPVLPLGVADRRVLDHGDLDLDAPVLSAIMISRDDEATIERSVRAVVEQEVGDPFEVIVVASGTDRTAEIVRRRFPGVRVISLPRGALPGAARNAGVRIARGDYLSFPGSHVELLPGSLEARVSAHERGFPMVTGSIINGTGTRSGWASYFLDHSAALPGRPSGELRAPPSHCSYARDFLLEVGGFPEDMRTGEDTVVNETLFARGYRAYRSRDIRLIHRSPCRDPFRLMTHHFRRGRAFGRILLGWGDEAAMRALAGYLPRRLRLTSSHLRRWGHDLRAEYRRALPLVVLGATSAWAGTWTEVGRAWAARAIRRVLDGGLTFLVAGLDRHPSRPIGRADLI